MKKTLTKYTLLALALVAMTGAPQLVQAQDAAPPAEPFTIALPAGYAAFAKQVQTAPSPEGQIETTNWVSKAPTGEAVVVTLSKMPAKILDPEKLIASTSASLLKSLGATQETDHTFRSNAAVFRTHYVVNEDRLFQLLYVGRSDEQRNQPAVAQMFESFKIN